MSVIKIRQQSEFSTLSNQILQNSSLSIEAIGLWAHCMSRPEDWTFYISQLCSQFKIGKGKMNKIINELISQGYAFRGQKLKVSENSLAGKRKVFSNIEYIFYPYKISVQELEKLKKEYPAVRIKKMFPIFENPLTENPLPENRPLQEIDGLQEKEAYKKPPNPQTGGAPKGAREMVAFGKFVSLEKTAYEEMCKLHGFETLMSLIEEMNDYLLATGKKPYKDYAAALRQWIKRRKQQTKPKTVEGQQLNDIQQKNWNLNQELVNDLKVDSPDKAGGLNFFYKHYILKDRNNPSFDVSALIDHRDFCRVLGKHLRLNIEKVRFPDVQI